MQVLRCKVHDYIIKDLNDLAGLKNAGEKIQSAAKERRYE